MPIRDVSTLGLDELLGALLSAVIGGQREATAGTLALVEQIGLLRDAEGHERFRTVTIRYTKLDENQQPAEFALEVPLLAMVAIPTLTVREAPSRLTVREAKISFTYDVTQTAVERPAEQIRGARAPVPRALTGAELRPVVLKGFVPRARTVSSSETRETAGINIEVTVESVPLPVGLERLLDLTELTVSRPVAAKQTGRDEQTERDERDEPR
ncbi:MULTISPECIES: DUF2589 domain-containing protein [unclassified Streptomyces]|uniref:DUF2589 domain-containing protein n=1 Tax=unclassified Streptomyces TaxID=2593676 RepID=UPI002DDA0686|nr:DUF2589 domain-containing protein [Streptomyces sp. NBC_01750]WSA97972.1 DUF2589 domain-containing protein [Streptomyces sp. NBC_01794]WSD37475.1 DUF2589 domain-containing protein [Streptomyces sp. NBC_01750]